MAFPCQTRASDDLVLDFLLVGDVQGWPNHLGDDEPAIDVTLVPCRAFGTDMPDEYLYRWSRIYLPRNLDALLDYEVLFFNHPRLSFFTIPQQVMMVDFTATRDRVSIAYPLSHYVDVQVPWLNSPLAAAFPVDAEMFYNAVQRGLPDEFDGLVRLRLEPGRQPVFSEFDRTGIFGSRIYESARPAYAKAGATIWVHMIDGPAVLPEAPAFLSWPYGESEAWAFGIHPGEGARHFVEAGGWWELIFLNICYYSGPGDPLTFDEALNMRLVKSQFSFYRSSTSMFQSVVDFVSNVGANTARAERILMGGNAIRDDAELDYLMGEYDSAKEKMDEALGIVAEAMEEAAAAKDRALFWVYVSEWSATAAVAMASGFVVWSLMIRKRLYREVKVTRGA